MGIFVIFWVLNSSVSYSQQLLNCNFNNYSNSGYIENIAKSWVNPSQKHSINGNSINYTRKGLQGEIIENSANRIFWI